MTDLERAAHMITLLEQIRGQFLPMLEDSHERREAEEAAEAFAKKLKQLVAAL